MEFMDWNEIIKEYKEARNCLWCPKHCDNWSRNEEEGFYHMWRAYHLAKSSETKQDLWYARLLYMVATEQRHSQFHSVLLNKYMVPCIEAYARAIKNGDTPSEVEYKNAKSLYDDYMYEDMSTSSSEENIKKVYSYIEGWTSEVDFQFHDSRVIEFMHDCSYAKLKLQFEETTITLIFEEVFDITVRSVDPEVIWISECYCYPAFHNKDLLIFDIGFYRILAKRIKILK